MKAPLTLSDETTLQISGQSSLAKLVRMAKLILVDEATMLDRLLLTDSWGNKTSPLAVRQSSSQGTSGNAFQW